MKKALSANSAVLLWVCILFAQDSGAQNDNPLSMPEGAIARLEGDPLSYSPDGTRLAVASGLGIWLHDVTGTKVGLLSPEYGCYFGVFAGWIHPGQWG